MCERGALSRTITLIWAARERNLSLYLSLAKKPWVYLSLAKKPWATDRRTTFNGILDSTL